LRNFCTISLLPELLVIIGVILLLVVVLVVVVVIGVEEEFLCGGAGGVVGVCILFLFLPINVDAGQNTSSSSFTSSCFSSSESLDFFVASFDFGVLVLLPLLPLLSLVDGIFCVKSSTVDAEDVGVDLFLLFLRGKIALGVSVASSLVYVFLFEVVVVVIVVQEEEEEEEDPIKLS
jgi:hypothetical protein